MKNIGFMVMLAFFVLAGTAIAQNELGKQRWKLAEVGGKEVKTGKAYLLFDEMTGTFAGNGSCNAISGNIMQSSNEPKFKINRVTKMLCSRPGAMETERDLLRALGESESFSVKNGVLKIFKGQRVVARFLAPGAQLLERAVAEKLSKTDWRLESIGIVPLDDKVNGPTLNFDSDPGLFGGDSGCNRLSGSYEVTEDSLVFGDVTTTLMACAGGRRKIEREFLDTFSRINRFAIADDGKLRFFTGETILLTFVPINKN